MLQKDIDRYDSCCDLIKSGPKNFCFLHGFTSLLPLCCSSVVMHMLPGKEKQEKRKLETISWTHVKRLLFFWVFIFFLFKYYGIPNNSRRSQAEKLSYTCFLVLKLYVDFIAWVIKSTSHVYYNLSNWEHTSRL